MVMVMIRIINIQMSLVMVLLPGLLLKTMSNRAQNLYLSGVLMPY